MKNRGKGNEWLLIKKKDFAAQPGWDAENDLRSVQAAAVDPASVSGAVKAPMPSEIAPMLATPAAALPEGPEWLFELKWDGVRALLFLADGEVKLLSRTGRRIEKQYPELAEISPALTATSAILDGEIVALDERGRPSFGLLQPRIGATSKAVGQLSRQQPVTYFVFDLLYLNGYDLRAVPLSERKRLLSAILSAHPRLRHSDHYPASGKKLFEFARQYELEGVLAKRAASPYESRRSSEWLKIKVTARQEFVICGYTHGDREYFGALVLGVYEKKKLRWVGNVGAGFDQQLLRDVHKRLQPLRISTAHFREMPGIREEITWVKPDLVCSVKFGSWTAEGRLRAPVFVGLREDVKPEDCVREVAVTTAPPSETPKLLPPKQAEIILNVDGRQLKFTNLNKIFYPQQGYTKRDVINYYDAVAPLLVPHLKDRPLSLKRYPNGIEGKFFFQKEAAEKFADWLRTEPIFSEHNQAPINFVVADDRTSLLYLANLGCIDQNPWMSRVGSLENPDFVLIDLDPSDCGYDRIVEAAQLVRQELDLLGLAGYPKTTGGDGMHIYLPIEPRYSYAQTRAFAEILARLVINDRPDLFTTPRTVARREKGKVYFDYLQISTGKTISAPYVLRAYNGAPVSTPLEWREVVKGLTPAQFHLGNVLERFQRLGDIFQPVLTKRQRLEDALAKLEGLIQK
jgi:bifunctional non-homologous end joining protein LigD